MAIQDLQSSEFSEFTSKHGTREMEKFCINSSISIDAWRHQNDLHPRHIIIELSYNVRRDFRKAYSFCKTAKRKRSIQLRSKHRTHAHTHTLTPTRSCRNRRVYVIYSQDRIPARRNQNPRASAQPSSSKRPSRATMSTFTRIYTHYTNIHISRDFRNTLARASPAFVSKFARIYI